MTGFTFYENKEANMQTLPIVDFLQELRDVMKKCVKFILNTLYISYNGKVDSGHGGHLTTKMTMKTGQQQLTTEQVKGVFDVSRTTKILRLPGPKCRSMSRGRRRFYVTSRGIFVGHEALFERTTPGNETVMMHISKPAQFETGETGPRTD